MQDIYIGHFVFMKDHFCFSHCPGERTGEVTIMQVIRERVYMHCSNLVTVNSCIHAGSQ